MMNNSIELTELMRLVGRYQEGAYTEGEVCFRVFCMLTQENAAKLLGWCPASIIAILQERSASAYGDDDERWGTLFFAETSCSLVPESPEDTHNRQREEVARYRAGLRIFRANFRIPGTGS